MKWKQKLSQLGLAQENLSVSIKNKIIGYNKLEKNIQDLEAELNGSNMSPNDKQSLAKDIKGLRDDLEDFDNTLVYAIEKYYKNKDRYDELKKHLKPKTKKADKVNNEASTETKSESKKDDKTADNQPSKAEEPKKKSSSFGWIAFAVLAGVVTLGAVNLLKKGD